MRIRTKIICTIGPAVNSVEMMIALINAGMNVARLNFSHGTHAEHLVAINNLKEAREKMKVPLGIMLDTKGPEIRIGKIKNNELLLKDGARWLLRKEDVEGDEHHVTVTPGDIVSEIPKGTTILFDNGYIISHVVDVTSEGVIVEIDHGGIIRSNKGVNVPNTNLNLPACTQKDILDLQFGCDNDIDMVAASFVRSADHVLTIRRILEEKKRSDVLVIAKIENHEGVGNFDSIIQVADGVMIARGDLGVEVPLSQVPRLQKMMIRKSYLAGKPSITATQMLESMITNPRPTRAEASDVANAIYDATSAVMLSGETAVGRYPIETVEVMRTIVEESEQDFDFRTFFDQHSRFVYHDVPSAVTLATVKTAYSSDAKAIFAFTSSGSTARLLSRLRPQMPIIAATTNKHCYHQMALNWGVIPYFCTDFQTLTEGFSKICNFGLEKEYVSYGDLVVVTAGSPFGISGTTNMMLVESIGDVLIRGHAGIGERVHSNITLLLTLEDRKPYSIRGQIIVIGKCDESYIPFIKEAAGVILQNNIEDTSSEKNASDICKELGKPLLIRADAADRTLKEGQLVTLAPDKAIVYKGVVF